MCWTDVAIQYMHIFFARSISLWTGSLDKNDIANRTEVIFFCVCRANRGKGRASFFYTSSLANDLHFALASIPLRRTKKLCLFCKLKNEENTNAGRKKKGGDRGGEEDREGEGRDNLPFLLLIPPSLPATSLEANSSWVLPTAVCLQAAALLLWLDNVHT